MEEISERTRQFIMNRDGIGFFKAILESYEDLGIFSVLDGTERSDRINLFLSF